MEKNIYDDMPLNVYQIIQVPVRTFWGCFGIGTGVLILFAIGFESMLVFGFWFTALAFILNVIILLIMIVNAFYYKEYQWLILQKTAVMLLNIPVAVLYIYLVFILLSLKI